MRSAKRHATLQRCFVHPTRDSGPQAWRCIAFDISETGIGLTLPVPLTLGTVLAVRAWGLPRACELRACVVRTTPVDSFWFTGCEFGRRLSDAELRRVA